MERSLPTEFHLFGESDVWYILYEYDDDDDDDDDDNDYYYYY